MFGISNYVNKDSQVYEENNMADLVYEQDNIKAASGDGDALVNEYEANTSDTDESEIPSTLFLPEEYVENTAPEKIIENNKDYILQKKEKYTESGAIFRIESNYIYFTVSEKAARVRWVNDEYIVQHYLIGEGISIPNAIIILLDFETDDILYKLVTDNYGLVEYHPFSLAQKIYCIVIAPDYNLEVSAPIIFESNQPEAHYLPITLLKEHDEFTSDFQIAINDLSGSAISNSTVYFDYILKENKENDTSHKYIYNTDEMGNVVLSDNYGFFELNTRYLIYVYLDDNTEYRTIDGSITNTNLFTVQFDYNQ